MSFTVLEETIKEIEVLSSRFIASLRHCNGDEDFAKHLKEMEERYPKAAHYCYGGRIGPNEKMGDDGEPGHSAGLQILSTLRHKNLDNVSLIIVRYFGGTKLGLPRLTRTYREAAEEVILASKLMTSIPGLKAKISVPYNEADNIKYKLHKAGFDILSTEYGEAVDITFSGEKEGMDKFLDSLNPSSILFKEEIIKYTEVTK